MPPPWLPIAGTTKTYDADVVGYDASRDIAVIKLRNASGMTPAPFGDSSTVKVGDTVIGMGNAGGAGGKPIVAVGKVTGLDCIRVEWVGGKMREVEGSEFVLKADLILLAMGFVGPKKQGLLDQAGVALDRVGCFELRERRPSQVSGGQLQRPAVPGGRARRHRSARVHGRGQGVRAAVVDRDSGTGRCGDGGGRRPVAHLRRDEQRPGVIVQG